MDQFGHQLGELKRLFRTLPPCDQNFALAMLSDSLNDMNVTVMLRQRLVDNSHRTMAAEAEFLIQERYGLPSPWPSTSHDDPMMMESFPDSAGGDHNDLINALFEGLPCSSDLPIEITDDAAQCDYTTKFRQNLARHRIRLHASKAPINCEYCGKDFKDKDAVKTHIKYVHENERSYKCAECDKSFVTATNRSRHLRLTHQNSRVYCCTTCSKNFQTAYHLKRHLAMVCNRVIANSKDKLISSVAAGRQ
uniref:C2H2-type domain-containing protein n=1 Tax=Plectus sambesii TaxID=2011161 RepID=A0A914VVH7_9BILA